MTKSAMGARLLKNYIDPTTFKKEAIEERLDIVEIFTQQFIQRESIKEILKEIYDLERLSSRIAFGNINARDLKWISSSLKVLPELKQQLYSFNEPLTDQLANQIIDLSILQNSLMMLLLIILLLRLKKEILSKIILMKN